MPPGYAILKVGADFLNADLRNGSKIDSGACTTKPQEKLPTSPDLEHLAVRTQLWTLSNTSSSDPVQVFVPLYQSRDGLDVFSCLWRGSYLSTWREIDNRLDKSVPTAFLTASPSPPPGSAVLPSIHRSIDPSIDRSIDRSGPPFIDHTERASRNDNINTRIDTFSFSPPPSKRIAPFPFLFISSIVNLFFAYTHLAFDDQLKIFLTGLVHFILDARRFLRNKIRFLVLLSWEERNFFFLFFIL